MIRGIFFVHFKANNNDFGEGLIIIEDGKINGGDESYIYRGKLDVYAGKLNVTIHVQHYRGPLNSVMGPMEQFTLDLVGSAANDTFEVTGGISNVPGVSIKIIGKKISELYNE